MILTLIPSFENSVFKFMPEHSIYDRVFWETALYNYNKKYTMMQIGEKMPIRIADVIKQFSTDSMTPVFVNFHLAIAEEIVRFTDTYNQLISKMISLMHDNVCCVPIKFYGLNGIINCWKNYPNNEMCIVMKNLSNNETEYDKIKYEFF